ncbi:sensor histidine kinase [Microbacterium halophytorum]|uniref:sensor histidine kinase n=1 Tax=Microbacterium halophytorum TaxID=2067568 RepID=UPI000CFD9B8A|nr:histidine kinase [Microbacterium halophytorum]
MPTTDPAETPLPWWFRHPARLDIVVLLVAVIPAVAGSVVLVFADVGDPADISLSLIPPGCAIAAALASHRFPRIALAVVALGTAATVPLHIEPTLAWTLMVFSAPLLTLRGPSAALVAWVGALANGAATSLNTLGSIDGVSLAASVIMVLAVTAMTAALKKQIEYLTAMQRQAREAIAARDREAERSIIEERLRIARDLHDAVGHEAAIVSVQISLAEVNLRKDPDTAGSALAEARGGVQGILHEMQRILEVLRFSEGEDASRPTGGTSALPELIASFRRVGLDVDAELKPISGRIDPAVDAAAYRMTQEALTNAQRYGAGRTEIALAESGGVIELRVANAIADPRPPSGSGFGLVGMRERVESAGGSLEITDEGGRFSIAARMRTTGERL